MGSNFPVSNESINEMIYEMNHVLNCGYESIGKERKGTLFKCPVVLALQH